jgi:hypothetical protein
MKPKTYIRLIFFFLFIASMIFAKKSQAQIQSMAGAKIGVTIIDLKETSGFAISFMLGFNMGK